MSGLPQQDVQPFAKEEAAATEVLTRAANAIEIAQGLLAFAKGWKRASAAKLGEGAKQRLIAATP